MDFERKELRAQPTESKEQQAAEGPDGESSRLEGADALQIYLTAIGRNFAGLNSQFAKLDAITQMRKQELAEATRGFEPGADRVAGAGPDRKPGD
jgi:hypothetical protein